MSISSIDLVALFTATACAEATCPLADRFAPRRANAREDAAEAVACTWPFCAATTRVEACRPRAGASTRAANAARAHAIIRGSDGVSRERR
jgi:hypothetical protein